jgi:hypothetical protein
VSNHPEQVENDRGAQYDLDEVHVDLIEIVEGENRNYRKIAQYIQKMILSEHAKHLKQY